MRWLAALAEKIGLTVEQVERDVAAARELKWVCAKIEKYPPLPELEAALNRRLRRSPALGLRLCGSTQPVAKLRGASMRFRASLG